MPSSQTKKKNNYISLTSRIGHGCLGSKKSTNQASALCRAEPFGQLCHCSAICVIPGSLKEYVDFGDESKSVADIEGRALQKIYSSHSGLPPAKGLVTLFSLCLPLCIYNYANMSLDHF